MKREERRWLRLLQEMGAIKGNDAIRPRKSSITQVIQAYDLNISDREREALEMIAKALKK